MFLTVGIVLRLIAIFLFKDHSNYDMDSWFLVGKETMMHHSIYPEISLLHHPYFPIMMYYYAVAQWLTRCGIPFAVSAKLLFAVFDVAISYLVYLISNRNKKLAWMYALNPVSIIVTCVQGQFDSIPVFFLLLSLYYANAHRSIYSTLSASAAIALKTWPAAFMIPLYRRMTSWRMIFLFGFVPVVTLTLFCITFQRSPLDVLGPIAGYRGVYGVFGLGYLLPFITKSATVSKLCSTLFLLAFAVYAVKTKSSNIYCETFKHMLFFFSFSITFGIQWLMWPVAFMLLNYRKSIWVYLSSATLYLGIANVMWWGIFRQIHYLSMIHELTGLIVWFSVLFLFYVESAKVKKSE